jgi:L-ascorbate metabolism protein UlaG (beta-lactamase superfamily)
MDPFGKGIGYSVPYVETEIVTISHHHFDHDYTGKIIGDFDCVDRPGSFRVGEVEILGIPTFHDKVQGRKRGPNVVYRVTMEGIKVCHLGDLGHLLSAEQINALGKVDILLVPIGGRFALDGTEAAQLRSALSPSITIPMHYRTKAMGIVGLLFARIDLFLAATNEKPSTVRELELEASSLSKEAGIVVMEYE